MASEGFEGEEWDADFLDQLVQAEEIALSSTQKQRHYPPSLHQPPPSYGNHINHSPPWELSQRVSNASVVHGNSNFGFGSNSFLNEQCDDKEEEIERLKKELARVSKKLVLLEEECLEIKKERDLKEEQLKSASSTTEKEGKVFCRKNREKAHHGVGIYDCSIPQYEKENSSKELLEPARVTISSNAVGIQTDTVGESDFSSSKNDLLLVQHHRNKLLDIWNSCNGKKIGRDLVLKLFTTCEVDLQVLFGYLNMRYPLKTKLDASQMGDESLMGLHESTAAAKVSHLYLILTKIGNEMVRFEDFLKALIDLSGLNNEVIVYRSLRILHAALKYAFSLKRTVSSRDNVVVTSSEHAVSDKFGHQLSGNESLPYAGTKILQPGNMACGENLSNARVNTLTLALSVSGVDWSSLFDLMWKITVKHLEEHIRLEAISIMNIIAMSCNAYSEREKFASVLFFQSISQLLKNEAGPAVRKQAVKLFYQLLNCPKVTAILFSGYQGQEDAATESDANISSTIQEFGSIMEGLVDCIACSDNSANELKLRRSAITLVAFLASLGKMGYAIILNDRHPGRNNILACILQSLMADVDFDALDSSPSSDVFRERTLLMREILIFLNRVVSHPQYSIPVLQALTSSRDVASLTVNIANRLSQKRKSSFQDDTITKQIREFEITELARVFKRRVFAFMGDGIP